ncbi:zinc finger protein 761-like [Toxorhynchites rutilus septentrionalis]|uniref:zinc finger protein 761-like n=1 Tax=Toxorhynchites rutilus septentrionalis TaxID=329112 RepID=UPI0024788409|nr:zinc finger protein 761-like [Toxorhynchites rutilus septentrionalis]
MIDDHHELPDVDFGRIEQDVKMRIKKENDGEVFFIRGEMDEDDNMSLIPDAGTNTQKTNELSALQKEAHTPSEHHKSKDDIAEEGQKPFKCKKCGKTFSLKYKLNAHVRNHTGKRPYSCPHCPKTFRRPSALKQHIRTHTAVISSQMNVPILVHIVRWRFGILRTSESTLEIIRMNVHFNVRIVQKRLRGVARSESTLKLISVETVNGKAPRTKL